MIDKKVEYLHNNIRGFLGNHGDDQNNKIAASKVKK